MTTPDVHEIPNPRFDRLRNESIEKTCAIHEERLKFWRDKAQAEQRISSPTAKVCPKR